MEYQTLINDLVSLSVALFIGLLIGLERGWKHRKLEEGKRLAGIRTFGLVGLLGGCSGLLTPFLGGLFLGLVFLALCLVFSVAYYANLQASKEGDVSVTSLVAGLLTFLLGSMATLGYASLAGACAVVVAVLLGIKPILHRWVNKIEKEELYATFKLLLISVVLLTALPNENFGPWKAFNPFEIWLMVVLVAAISYVGYFSVKIMGARKGNIITAFFAGMSSSTALTFYFSRLARQRKDISKYLVIGILMACGLMFIRMLIYAVLLSPDLLKPLSLPCLVLAGLLCLPLVSLLNNKVKNTESVPLHNPLELKWAVSFGILLVIITFLSRMAQEEFGRMGLYGLSLIAGFVDIDALVLSLTRMNSGSTETIAFAAMLAALSNTALKGILAFAVGGRSLLVPVTLPLILVVAFGGGLSWWWLLA